MSATSPKAARRRAGRAIRKARRQARIVHVRLVGSLAPYIDGLCKLQAALGSLGAAVVAVDWPHIVAELERTYAERQRAHRDWMLTYRALTTLDEGTPR